MIAANNISFSYGYEPVLDQVSFLVSKGQKVGLVGPNGAGKTTLFKLLTKEEFPSEGTLEIQGQLHMVPQEVIYDSALAAAANVADYIDPRHTVGQFRREQVLQGLEFTLPMDTTHLEQLSGGQKTKLALARALLAQPDILLLDEPTNFLDDPGKKWVMHFLGQYKKTVIIVSHDLSLLDHHIKKVLYLNPQTHQIDTYAGNYSAFVRIKKQQDALLTRQIRNEHQHLQRMEAGLVKLQRLTSDKGVRQRVMLQRRIERIKDVLPELPKELRLMRAAFPPPAKVGALPIRGEHIYKSFGGQSVLKDVSLDILRGERVALVGPNGSGKTTLIKILTGSLAPDSGRVMTSDSLNYGYYSQEFQNFDENKTLEEVVKETEALPDSRIYPFLGRFLFPHSRLHQKMATLSGGEKTRLSIALLMLHQHNLLILDEPTTYLDVMSQRVILEALKDYTGAMLIVSHTREFVAELQPQRVLMLPANKTLLWSPELGEQVTEI
jgi:ATP-binding cassette, subfamily F, member 3